MEYLWEDIGEIEPSKIDALPSSKDTFNRLFEKRLNVSTLYIINDYVVIFLNKIKWAKYTNRIYIFLPSVESIYYAYLFDTRSI